MKFLIVKHSLLSNSHRSLAQIFALGSGGCDTSGNSKNVNSEQQRYDSIDIGIQGWDRGRNTSLISTIKLSGRLVFSIISMKLDYFLSISMLFKYALNLKLNIGFTAPICICFDGVVFATQCTAAF